MRAAEIIKEAVFHRFMGRNVVASLSHVDMASRYSFERVGRWSSLASGRVLIFRGKPNGRYTRIDYADLPQGSQMVAIFRSPEDVDCDCLGKRRLNAELRFKSADTRTCSDRAWFPGGTALHGSCSPWIVQSRRR